MSEHLALWNQVEKTDPRFTKEFNRGGGFKGTAINPTYLARKATETFGPVGIGWGWEIVQEELMIGAPIAEGVHEVIHALRVKVWFKLNGERGELEHFGATTFVGKNKYGAFTDEEAKKKSLTDAIGKCLSLLGFSSDVHLGKYDDNKYVNDRRNEEAAKEKAASFVTLDLETVKQTVLRCADTAAINDYWKSLPLTKEHPQYEVIRPLFAEAKARISQKGLAPDESRATPAFRNE